MYLCTLEMDRLDSAAEISLKFCFSPVAGERLRKAVVDGYHR